MAAQRDTSTPLQSKLLQPKEWEKNECLAPFKSISVHALLSLSVRNGYCEVASYSLDAA